MSKRVNRDDIDKLHDYGLYLPTRTIYMGSVISDLDGEESGVDAYMAERIVKNLHVLDQQNQEPITIVMNNIGGDEYHGYAIYDAIKACRSKVIIEVLGHAMSMGSIILQAADERVMHASARMMIHYGSAGYDGHAKSFQKWADEGKFMDKMMEDIYMDKIKEKHPLFPINKLKKMCDHDTFLSAKEAVEMGLADKVFGEE